MSAPATYYAMRRQQANEYYASSKKNRRKLFGTPAKEWRVESCRVPDCHEWVVFHNDGTMFEPAYVTWNISDSWEEAHTYVARKLKERADR